MEQEIIPLLGKSKIDPLTQKINELKEETEYLRKKFQWSRNNFDLRNIDYWKS